MGQTLFGASSCTTSWTNLQPLKILSQSTAHPAGLLANLWSSLGDLVSIPTRPKKPKNLKNANESYVNEHRNGWMKEQQYAAIHLKRVQCNHPLNIHQHQKTLVNMKPHCKSLKTVSGSAALVEFTVFFFWSSLFTVTTTYTGKPLLCFPVWVSFSDYPAVWQARRHRLN